MKIINSKKKLAQLRNESSLGLVPTMGAIHTGHISLIKKSISECKKTIVSIFINKRQFNNKKDYKKYPRILKKDLSLLKKYNIDYLFLPKEKIIYPKGGSKNLQVDPFSRKLCGKNRPGHFKAVVDVIDRFIKLIKPSKIYFGEKDFQQLIIVKNYIKRKKINTTIVKCKTIREKNGLALSSRNLLLSRNERKIASKVYKMILNNKKKILNKKITIKKVKQEILNLGVKRIDYLELLKINKIIYPPKKKVKYKIFIAYYMNNIRLIDNI